MPDTGLLSSIVTRSGWRTSLFIFYNRCGYFFRRQLTIVLHSLEVETEQTCKLVEHDNNYLLLRFNNRIDYCGSITEQDIIIMSCSVIEPQFLFMAAI